MKILIYGAGVIGCTYGWQLSKAGCGITVLVRKGKKQIIEKDGICIHCIDYRGSEKQIEQEIFRPKVIEELSPQNDYEYIIVSTRSLHRAEVLPVLAQSAGKAHILFFQNMWDGIDEISKYLSHEQYFFGFPFMVGGGRKSMNINAVISGSKYSKTMLGEISGKITPRVQKIADALEKVSMRPFISRQIMTWLIPHSVFIAGLSAGIVKAGGRTKKFTSDTLVVKEAIKAIREGFCVCRSRGIDPKQEKVNKLYYLPLFISAPIVKKIFSDETMCLMFDGYLEYSVNEIEKILEDIIECGEKQNVKTPHLKRLKEDVSRVSATK